MYVDCIFVVLLCSVVAIGNELDDDDLLEGSCDLREESCDQPITAYFTPSPEDPPSFNKYYNLIKRQWTDHPIDEDNTKYNNTSPNACTTAFDSVISKNLLLWKQKGGISYDAFTDAKSWGVHYQILDHKLYRQKDCLFERRCKGVEHYLLEIIEDIPDTEFIINVHDWPKSPKHSPPRPVLSFSKDNRNYDIMYPAWTFWCGGPAITTEPKGLGRWDLKRKTMVESFEKWPWSRKHVRGFFRGSRTSSERDPLILLSRAKPYLVDALYTKNQAWKSIKDTLGAEPAEIVPLEEHCSYKYLFNFQGVAASFRYKHLFLCGSLVFQVDSKWVEFFYDSLIPWVHYVPVDSNCDNVEELIEFMKGNDHLAEMIAQRGYRFILDNLTPESIVCYWRTLLLNYTKLIKWNPVKVTHYDNIVK